MRISALLLLASLAGPAFGDPTSDFLKRIGSAESREEFSQALDAAPPEVAEDPGIPLSELQTRTNWEQARTELKTALETRQLVAGPEGTSSAPADAQAKAEEILSRPIYADEGPAAQRNWLSDAFAEIGEFLNNLFDTPEVNGPRVSPGVVAGGGILAKGVLVLLALCLLAGVAWALWRFQWGRRKKLSRGGGLLDDDEPDRTADEWLTRAESMANKGDYRGAVRCLYLASLMRFDEHGVARFDRSETNWEHLRRIQASKNAPIGFDFQPSTLLFDNVWYGKRWNEDAEYLELKEMYTRLLQSLSAGRAA